VITKVSMVARAEKIDVRTNTREAVKEAVATEAPVNVFVNDEYVITLLATPELQRELALGWLLDEGVLQSLNDIRQVVASQDSVNVLTEQPIEKERLQVVSVSRLHTTSCALSANKFFKTISKESGRRVESDYKVQAGDILKMAQKLDEGRLYQSTGGVHVAALFEEGRLVALAEDIGRHNTIDKVVGIGLQSKANFSNSVLVSSGRQPADMVLKAARMGIPVIVSIAAPIRSGIIASEKAGVTLVCFVRNQTMNVYTHSYRVLTNKG